MLECNYISKYYMNKTAVNHVTLSLQPGKIYALLGSNGSGKSTFMKMISGLIKPSTGTITLDGTPVGVETKKRIAYMPTENYFYSYMTCEDIGKYYQDFFEDFSYEKYLSMLNDMELEPKQKASKMSSGMLAKLKLAVTLSRNSDVIMLDEPLNGIDIIARDHIINAIISNATPDKTFIMSSHLVDELEPIIDYAIFIKNGILVAHGDAENLREQSGKSIVDQYKELFA